jgi:hypothetical protein
MYIPVVMRMGCSHKKKSEVAHIQLCGPAPFEWALRVMWLLVWGGRGQIHGFCDSMAAVSGRSGQYVADLWCCVCLRRETGICGAVCAVKGTRG